MSDLEFNPETLEIEVVDAEEIIKATKQERIKEAYGRFYDDKKYHYSINGWSDPESYSELEMEEMMQEINMEFGEFRCRPKSLQGIENK